MSVTAETSHDPIGPCGPFEQSEDSLMHCTMAALSSALDFGAHLVTTVVGGVVVAGAAVVAVRLRLGLCLRYK